MSDTENQHPNLLQTPAVGRHPQQGNNRICIRTNIVTKSHQSATRSGPDKGTGIGKVQVQAQAQAQGKHIPVARIIYSNPTFNFNGDDTAAAAATATPHFTKQTNPPPASSASSSVFPLNETRVLQECHNPASSSTSGSVISNRNRNRTKTSTPRTNISIATATAIATTTKTPSSSILRRSSNKRSSKRPHTKSHRSSSYSHSHSNSNSNSNSTKGINYRWSKQEDQALANLVRTLDPTNSIVRTPRSSTAIQAWHQIAKAMKPRSMRACRLRWARKSFAVSTNSPENMAPSVLQGFPTREGNGNDTYAELSSASTQSTSSTPSMFYSNSTDSSSSGVRNQRSIKNAKGTQHEGADVGTTTNTSTCTRTPGTSNRTPKNRKGLQWSPFLFAENNLRMNIDLDDDYIDDTVDHDTAIASVSCSAGSGLDLVSTTSLIPNNVNMAVLASQESPGSRSGSGPPEPESVDIDIDDTIADLSPLDFQFAPNFDFTGGETNALLSILGCKELEDSVVNDLISGTRTRTHKSKEQQTQEHININEADTNSVWGSGLIKEPMIGTPYHTSNMDPHSTVPNMDMGHHNSTTVKMEASEDTTGNSNSSTYDMVFDTPPKCIEASSPRYSSAVSSLATSVRTTMTRKKRRVAPSSILRSRTPSTPDMPKLNEAKELDLVFTGTKPYFRLVDYNKEDNNIDLHNDESTGHLYYGQLDTPTLNECDGWSSPRLTRTESNDNPESTTNSTPPVKSRNELFRALTSCSKGTKSSWSEPRSMGGSSSIVHGIPIFAATPHPPQTPFKQFHSEPKRNMTEIFHHRENHYPGTTQRPISWSIQPRPGGKLHNCSLSPYNALRVVGMDLNRTLFEDVSSAAKHDSTDISGEPPVF